MANIRIVPEAVALGDVIGSINHNVQGLAFALGQTAIPEPSSFELVTIGFLAMARLRRKSVRNGGLNNGTHWLRRAVPETARGANLGDPRPTSPIDSRSQRSCCVFG